MELSWQHMTYETYKLSKLGQTDPVFGASLSERSVLYACSFTSL